VEFYEYPAKRWEDILEGVSTNGRDLTCRLVRYESRLRLLAAEVSKIGKLFGCVCEQQPFVTDLAGTGTSVLFDLIYYAVYSAEYSGCQSGSSLFTKHRQKVDSIV
jgi:hypothetical protein